VFEIFVTFQQELIFSYVITDLVSLTTVQEEYKKRNLLNELYMAQKDEMHKCCEQESYKQKYILLE
jgi:hypothetical protein